MINPIATFIFTVTGAFAIWVTKGFKGPFDKAMVSVDERNSKRGTIRYFLGMGIWIAVITIISIILTRPTDTDTVKFKGRLNEKGELEEIR